MHVHGFVDVHECECVCAPFKGMKRKGGIRENLDHCILDVALREAVN